jgi:hypothetical protein
MPKKTGDRKIFGIKFGGAGAADHALNTYGNFDQQMAQLKDGNVLHAAGQPVAAITGGSCGVPLVQGGSALSQVAVPAVLLVANNRYGKTRKSMKKFKMRKPNMRFMKSRKYRGSRRSRSGKR